MCHLLYLILVLTSQLLFLYSLFFSRIYHTLPKTMSTNITIFLCCILLYINKRWFSLEN